MIQEYDSYEQLQIERLKQYGKLSPKKKAEIEKLLADQLALSPQFQTAYKISTYETILKIRG
jgi:hypothetical protein